MYDAQLDLEGIPSQPSRVTVGYQLKNFETAIDPLWFIPSRMMFGGGIGSNHQPVPMLFRFLRPLQYRPLMSLKSESGR